MPDSGLLAAPTVVVTTPLSGATNVPVNDNLSATFSEMMDPLTLDTASFTLHKGLTAVAGSVTYAGNTAIFDPVAALDALVEYSATITTAAEGVGGNALASNHVWTFTTGALPDTTPPTVSSTAPMGGNEGVSVTGNLAATFSEAMDPLTVDADTFTLRQGTTPVSGTVTYAGITAVFDPDNSLAPFTVFQATVSSAVTDLAGNPMLLDYSWTFTTGAMADTTAPTVTSTAPANGATGVTLESSIAATFNESMAPLTITTVSFRLDQGTTPVPSAVSYAGVTAMLSPTNLLQPSTTYTATITTVATDLAGNPLASDKTWSFVTGLAADVTRPTVLSTSPTNTEVGVSITGNISATFSEAMNPSSVTDLAFTLTQGTNPILGTVTYAGDTAAFNPTSDLSPNTGYTGTITTGVMDLAGNALFNNHVWTFVTGSAGDTTPPTVNATAPVGGAIGVSPAASIEVTFSEPMDPLTVTTATFTLEDGLVSVAGSLTYAGVTAIFSPDSDLAVLTEYTCTISSASSDLAGNTMTSDHVWTFTTGDGLPPTLAVNLGTAGTFAILSKTGIASVPTSSVTGNIGVSPGAASLITGFTLIADATNVFATSDQVVGQVFAADYAPPTPSNMTTAIADMETAFTDAAGRAASVTELGAGNIGGMTLTPGVYKWGTGLLIPADLTLAGGATAVWIFQIAQDLTVSPGKKVFLTGGALAKNVFWQVAGFVDLDTTSHVEGILMSQTSITLHTGATVTGRLLAQTAVNIDSSVVVAPAN